MTNTTRRLGVVLSGLLLVACGGAVPGTGGGGKVDPNACSGMDASDVGRKLKAFLDATAKLQARASELENNTKEACAAIASDLGAEAKGNTKEVCAAAAKAIEENLKVSLKAGAKMEVTYKPAECTVSAEASAKAKAECSGSASGSAEGSTGSGGSASGSADAACEASGEVHASLEVECKPAELTINAEAGMAVDATKLEKVKATLQANLPKLLEITGKAEALAKAVVKWSATAKDLAASADTFAKEFAGKAALCVSGQLSAAAGAAASIDVSVSVSVEASASVGGSASGAAGGG